MNEHPSALPVQGITVALSPDGYRLLAEQLAPLVRQLADELAVGQWLTPAQVAERLQVSDSHVRRMIARGELPAMRSGEVTRVPAAALVWKGGAQ